MAINAWWNPEWDWLHDSDLGVVVFCVKPQYLRKLFALRKNACIEKYSECQQLTDEIVLGVVFACPDISMDWDA